MSQFKKSTKQKNIIVISLGDPAGIGTEITLKALGSQLLNENIKPLLVGCKKNIYKTYLELIDHEIKNIPNPKDLDIIDIPLENIIIPGIVNSHSGNASFKWLYNAANLVLEG